MSATPRVVPRLAVEDFFGAPVRAGASISPDGTRIAYLAPWRERLNVWVEGVDADEEARCVTALFGVAVASFVAWKTGSAKGFFLTGIWANVALLVLFLLSVLVRRPLTGVVWGALNGTGTTWLKDKPSRHYYDIATLTLVSVFGAQVAVWQWLYDEDRTGWLAVARIAMGYPLLSLALLVVLWAGRRSGKRLKALAGQQPAGSV
ncbi:hypothetical protein GCM10023080_069570 [Streptomyces pseudoechinosporeus]